MLQVQAAASTTPGLELVEDIFDPLLALRI
jgi:hypothetical protein